MLKLFSLQESIRLCICDSGSVGGVRPCQGRGRGFESRLSLLILIFMRIFWNQEIRFFFCEIPGGMPRFPPPRHTSRITKACVYRIPRTAPFSRLNISLSRLNASRHNSPVNVNIYNIILSQRVIWNPHLNRIPVKMYEYIPLFSP